MRWPERIHTRSTAVHINAAISLIIKQANNAPKLRAISREDYLRRQTT